MKYIPKIILIFTPSILSGMSLFDSSQNKLIAEGFTQSEERDIFESIDQDKKGGSVLPTTPMELIQTLQRSTSRDDATSPEDALDEALRFFNDQEIKNNSSINN